ncbi:TRZ/ATZ family hydrolase [Exilibacterium tricleocarpae]|uniref:5-methylthioadenosine/S-adenosylhomocysteine deaminase n=1 Tax=Exilibacterium tricleocarpae TaxID=2591008 RepID=A0A545U430_9GAMM|nr:TRZ/ATZ family hydrolase [Exilibacterium tricleocarpae]TQV84204.1 TRZ/ATZ family hydrolase [Exilibacterium tricleocarpae]
MTAPETVDLLINARWIIPVVPEDQVFEHCSIAVNDGQILAIVPQAEATRKFAATDTVDLPEHLVIPGLINAHGHAAMSLLRGFADDTSLHDWLEQHIWPAEQRWVDPQFVRDGANLAIAEMIRSGTSCFADMYFYPEETAAAAQHAGIRAQVAFPILDFATVWGRGPDEYISKGLALHDDYRSQDLVHMAFGPHAPYTVGDGPLSRVATLAEELQVPIQIHLHETAQEVREGINAHGVRPSERLANLGLLSPLAQCVHLTQVDDGDIERLALSGARAIHCPESNLKLASGFCPVARLLEAGITVALGTDSAASNNDLSLLGEMRTAALLAKGVASDARAVNARQALRMATLDGARALGLEDKTGSLEPGKAADICALQFDELELQPLYHPLSQLVYTDNSQRVSHLWVAGKALLKERQLQTLSARELTAKARQWQVKLAGP